MRGTRRHERTVARPPGTARGPAAGGFFTPAAAGATRLQRKCAACEQEDKLQRAPHGGGRVQPQLAMSAPGDADEREADAVADRVMRMKDDEEETVQTHAAPGRVQRLCPECEQELQAKRRGGAGARAAAAPAVVEDARRSGGRALDGDTRSFMESRMGRDFGDVRIHDDAVAARSAKSIDALAFTYGRDVVFGAGQYAPGSDRGRRLLAHELTHVVQQRSAPARVMRIPDEDGIRETPPRYSFSTNCGWIDWSHASPGLPGRIIAAVRSASDRMRRRGTTAPEPVSTPPMTSTPLGLTTITSVAVNAHIKRPLSGDEILSVALRLFMLQSLGFEALQQWTELVGSSSFSEEDLPSNMLSFYMDARSFGRSRIESLCGVMGPAASLAQFRRHTFRKTGQFTPLSLPSGGRWPADLSTITPAQTGGPLMDLPQGRFSTVASSFTRGLAGYQIITDGSLHIASLSGGSTIDISGTQSGAAHSPHFEVRPLITGHDLRCRWIIKDSSDRRYLMLGNDGSSVFRYNDQFDAFINAPTRALLRSRGIRDATVLCRVIVGGPGQDASLQRLLELPVRFTW